MPISHTKRCITAICGIACGFVFQAAALACGANWREPKSHYDGADYQGNVHLIENLGEIYAGSGLKIPIYAIFNSTFGESPYLSSGWEIPLLESKILQVDESTFMLTQPDGWLWPFVRTKDPSILEGTAGWKAEIQGDIITAWASCGTKIRFSKGRIVQLQLKSRTFDYVYSGNRVSEIREDGKTLLKVNTDIQTGYVIGLTFSPGKTVLFERGSRPRVLTVNGRNVIVGVDETVTKFNFSDKSSKSFEFAVDQEVRPSVEIDSARTIVWNPATSKIHTDNDWTYEIKLAKDRFGSAAIGRKNTKGQMEFWSRDNSKGRETTIRADGSKYERSWFTSGVTAGKTRKFTTTGPTGKALTYAYSYDDKGQLLRRKMGNDVLEVFERNADSSYRVLKHKNDQLAAIDAYGPDGKKIASEVVGEKLTEFNHQSDGSTKVLTYSLKTDAPQGTKSLISEEIVNKKIIEP